ncbi:MAG: HAMP domain-containing protein, partial [bacterium]
MQSGIIRKIIFSYLFLVFSSALGYVLLIILFNKSNILIEDINTKQEVMSICDEIRLKFENQVHFRNNYLKNGSEKDYFGFINLGDDIIGHINTLQENAVYQKTSFRNILNMFSDSLITYHALVKETPQHTDNNLLDSLKVQIQLYEKQIKNIILALGQDVDRQIIHAIRKAEDNNRWTYNLALIMFFFMIILAIYMTYSLSSTIITPLRQLLIATKFIGKGNFNEIEDIKIFDNEIGELANAFIDMGKELESYRGNLVKIERVQTAAQIAARVSHEINNP